MVGARRASFARPPTKVAVVAYELKKLNNVHDVLLEYLVCNPQMSQREIAKELGYTEAWLSTIINSDLFQAQYRELCEERRQPALHSIRDKMTRAAAAALDKIQERLDGGLVSDQFLINLSPALLDRIGYNPKNPTPGHLHVEKHDHYYGLGAEDIERAREKARKLNEGTMELEAG